MNNTKKTAKIKIDNKMSPNHGKWLFGWIVGEAVDFGGAKGVCRIFRHTDENGAFYSFYVSIALIHI